jgi:Uma2 family endonuclease
MKITLDIPQADLEKLISPAIAEPRISLGGVTWQQYESLIEVFGDRPRLRLSYLEETLEIMTNSPEHEMIKTLIGRLIETYALETDIDLYSCGSATYRREATARGLEPDESYCVGTRKEIPDFAIEVVITSGGIDKLKIYKGLNVREVWFWQDGQFTLHRLIDSTAGYEPISRSQLLPELDLNLLAQYINPTEEPQMVRAYRLAIRRPSV